MTTNKRIFHFILRKAPQHTVQYSYSPYISSQHMGTNAAHHVLPGDKPTPHDHLTLLRGDTPTHPPPYLQPVLHGGMQLLCRPDAALHAGPLQGHETELMKLLETLWGEQGTRG